MVRIYDCTIRHVRRGPVRNDFTYRSFLWLIDLDHVPRLPGPLRLLAGFRAADHGGDPGESLRANLESYLEAEGVDTGGGRVLMLAAARSFGHVFNPLTVYWCHGRDGQLACVVAEVHNTYGERHRYLLRPDAAGCAETDKDFYVSPFYPVAGRYRMSLPEPDGRLDLAIRYDPPGAAPFTAQVHGRARPATVAGVLRSALTQPCPTALTAARIRYQGVRLYLRGLPVVPRRSSEDEPGAGGVAARLAGAYRDVAHRDAAAGGELPIGVRAWDGSRAGPATGPTLVIASPRALSRLVWAPNELGLAQAYVTGEIDVEGDPAEGLRRVWDSFGDSARPAPAARALAAARLVAAAARSGALGPRPAPPASQIHVSGRVHTIARDRAVIAGHYDLSNDFYALLLDESMAYSSAYWRSDPAGHTLADAQRAKYDLICRKLELAPGMRLLDIGCGWGGLLMYAAEHHGVDGLGLTLSRQQAAYITAKVAERGLKERVKVRIQHFRQFAEPRAFDAVASIEMGEHVGAQAYPAYTSTAYASLKPGGRALIQQMSRASGAAPGGGSFIESFIAPDMHMRPLPDTLAAWRAAGFTVLGTESLREDYVRTIDAWRDALEASWAEAVDLVGEETARVWRLYLAGGRLAFEQRRMGVDQILLTTPGGGDDVGH